MPAVALSPIPILQFFNNLGQPAVGGSLTTQVGGVNYPTYSDPLGATPLPNPIPLNSRGEISTAAGASSELFLQQGVSYTFILKDANGNQLWSIGNITTPGQQGTLPTSTGSANAQVVTNITPISLQAGVTQWFLPLTANTGAMTLNVDNTGAISVLFLNHALLGQEVQPIPTLVIYNGAQWVIPWTAKGPATDYYIDTGTVNALVVASGNFLQNTAAVIGDGILVKVKAANTTTGAATLTFTSNPNINGAINLSDGTTAAPAGSIISGKIYLYLYSGGVWILINPSRVTGSFTGTLTGFSGTAPTGTVNYAILPTGKDAQVWGASITSANSNTTALTMTGVPAALTTTTSKAYTVLCENNTTGTIAVIITGTSTTWTFGNPGAASWSATGTKGVGTTATPFGWTQALD